MADDPQGPAPRTPAPQIHPVFVFPTPDRRDLLFYTEHDARLPKHKPGSTWAYGDAFPGPPSGYPNHKLVYVTPQSADNWERRWWAADWQDQDNHNWLLASGQELIRSYLVKRSDYRERPAGSPDPGDNEFFYPPAATLDTVFTSYGFADDTVLEAPQELRGLYVMVRRRFIEPVTEEIKYLEDFKRFVRVKRELVQPEVSPSVPAAPALGVKIEMLHGSKFHDVKITYTMDIAADTSGGVASWLANTGYDTRDYNFPPQLLSPVTIPFLATWADSTEAAYSYDLDFYFKFTIVEPRQGPYQATILTYFTSNPAALIAANPLTVVPSPQRETIPAAFGWYYASAKGNQTFAYCKQIEVPATVHDVVTVSNSELGLAPSGGTVTQPAPTNLAATTGFVAFKALTLATLDVKVEPVDFGLYRVTVLKLNVSGIYA